MSLPEADVQLFLATCIVQAFVDALPPSPQRELDAAQRFQSQFEIQIPTKRHNAITVLRFGVGELARVLTKDRVVYDLPDDALDKASKALGDLLYMQNDLVDNGNLKEYIVG